MGIVLQASVLVAATLLSAPALLAHDGSGYLQGCRLAASSSVGQEVRAEDSSEALQAGVCIGVINAVVTITPVLPDGIRFCAPPTADVGQAIRIVDKFMKEDPARKDMSFMPIVLAALGKAWPCL
jgi:Rap1a immunity proteins